VNAFLRNVIAQRELEHEAQLVSTPLDALPVLEPEKPSKLSARLLVRAERRKLREELLARAEQLRAGDWTWREIAQRLNLTQRQVDSVARALARKAKR
jgi:transcriptional regulator with GAF, ATPase, and Fis domain